MTLFNKLHHHHHHHHNKLSFLNHISFTKCFMLAGAAGKGPILPKNIPEKGNVDCTTQSPTSTTSSEIKQAAETCNFPTTNYPTKSPTPAYYDKVPPQKSSDNKQFQELQDANTQANKSLHDAHDHQDQSKKYSQQSSAAPTQSPPVTTSPSSTTSSTSSSPTSTSSTSSSTSTSTTSTPQEQVSQPPQSTLSTFPQPLQEQLPQNPPLSENQQLVNNMIASSIKATHSKTSTTLDSCQGLGAATQSHLDLSSKMPTPHSSHPLHSSSAPSMPQEQPAIPSDRLHQELAETELLHTLEEKGLVTYGASGSYGQAGSPQVTREGYEIKRIISGNEGLIPQKKQEIKQADNSDIQEVAIESAPQSSYLLGTTTISDDTIIPTPAQDHIVVVKKSDNDQSLEVFAYLTSQKGINTDVGKVPNTKISDTKVSGQQQSQYAVPIIPPQKVQQGDFNDLEEKSDVILQNPQTLAALDMIYEETSQYDPIDYKTQGITVEDLHEMNQVYDEMNKNKDSTDHTDEFDYKKEEVD